MELEELEAYLNLALPQGLLDKEPSPLKKKLKLYLLNFQKYLDSLPLY